MKRTLLLAALLPLHAARLSAAAEPAAPLGAAFEAARALCGRSPLRERKSSKRKLRAADADTVAAWLRSVRTIDPAGHSDEQVLAALAADGHAVERHGPQVSDEYLKGRLSRLSVATKFATRRAMVRSARRAWTAAEEAIHSDRRFLRQMGQLMRGQLRGVRLDFLMDEPVGVGFRKTPSGPVAVSGAREVAALFQRDGSKVFLVTLYPLGRQR